MIQKRPQPQHAHTPPRDQIRCFVNFSIIRQFSECSLWYTEGVSHTDVPHFFPQHLCFHWSPVFTATAPQSSVSVQCKRCWMLKTSRSLVHSQPGVNAKPQNKRIASEGSVAWSETVQPMSNKRKTRDTKCTQTVGNLVFETKVARSKTIVFSALDTMHTQRRQTSLQYHNLNSSP